jgi:hypothetical protein
MSGNGNEMMNDSQLYDDDMVYTVHPGSGSSSSNSSVDNYANDDDCPSARPSNGNSSNGNYQPALVNQAFEENRPDAHVKARKNIRVVFVHDLSGSMEQHVRTVATGTNEFLQDLQMRYAKPCEYNAQFLLITFSGDNITVGEWRNVVGHELYSTSSFKCHGCTPLWDACDIGLDKIINDCQDVTACMYAFTDGDDNNSKKATRETIRAKVDSLDPAKHTMLFIGSDPMSRRNADEIGLDRHRSLNPTSEDTPSAMRACTNTIARCVTGETQTPEFNDSDIMMSEGHR